MQAGNAHVYARPIQDLILPLAEIERRGYAHICDRTTLGKKKATEPSDLRKFSSFKIPKTLLIQR
jgi:hypothetical protein